MARHSQGAIDRIKGPTPGGTTNVRLIPRGLVLLREDCAGLLLTLGLRSRGRTPTVRERDDRRFEDSDSSVALAQLPTQLGLFVLDMLDLHPILAVERGAALHDFVGPVLAAALVRRVLALRTGRDGGAGLCAAVPREKATVEVARGRQHGSNGGHDEYYVPTNGQDVPRLAAVSCPGSVRRRDRRHRGLDASSPTEAPSTMMAPKIAPMLMMLKMMVPPLRKPTTRRVSERCAGAPLPCAY